MRNNKYFDEKEFARQEAIEWQTTCSEKEYSYGELSEKLDYFYKLGKRYGLLEEFRENGII